jgi:hypothetical protein
MVGCLGSTGAGKSTLLNALVGCNELLPVSHCSALLHFVVVCSSLSWAQGPRHFAELVDFCILGAPIFAPQLKLFKTSEVSC